MNDTITRGRKALKRIIRRDEEEQWIYGTVGRLLDGVPVFDVTGLPGYVYVTIRQANGAQTWPPARNDAAVAHALGLPVRMRWEAGHYVIDRVAKRADLAFTDPADGTGLPPHTHDDRYFRETEITGAADLGAPADTDKLVAVRAGGLGTLLISAIKTAFNALYVTVTGSVAQTITGEKTFTSTITQRSTVGLAHITAIGDGVRGTLSAKSFRNNANLSLFQFTSARGTEAVPLTVASGDRVAELAAYGYSQAAVAFLVAGTIAIRIDGTPDSGGDTTDMPGRFEFSTSPDGSDVPVAALVIDSAQNVAINPTKAAADVRFWVVQPALGSVVQRLQSTATNDDAIADVVQNKVTTTDATVTTLHTFAIPSSSVYSIHAFVLARRTGGVSGTGATGDGAEIELRGRYKNVGGTVTLIGALTQVIDREAAGASAAWTATLTVSGTNVLLQVTGAASMNVSWMMTRAWTSPLAT